MMPGKAMTTTMARKEAVERQWLLINAEGQIFGRMCTEIATILMGKHKPTYTPHVDVGDHVVVVNAAKVAVTGNKEEGRVYTRWTGYPGGLRTETLGHRLAHNPAKLIRESVRRMLPKNKLGRRMLAKLNVYAGPEHPHAAQKPEPYPLKRSKKRSS